MSFCDKPIALYLFGGLLLEVKGFTRTQVDEAHHMHTDRKKESKKRGRGMCVAEDFSLTLSLSLSLFLSLAPRPSFLLQYASGGIKAFFGRSW